MEKVRYKMIFRHSISEEQENILNGHIQHGLLTPMEKDIRGKLKYVPGVAKAYMESLVVDAGGHPRFWTYFGLNRLDDKTYLFTAPDIDAFMGVKEIVKAARFIGESKLYENFLRRAIKDMKIEDGAYKITKEKMEETQE